MGPSLVSRLWCINTLMLLKLLDCLKRPTSGNPLMYKNFNGIMHQRRLTRDAGVIKDLDREVRDRIALVFTSFLEQGSVGKVMRSFARRDLGVPQCDRFGEAVWRPATLDRI